MSASNQQEIQKCSPQAVGLAALAYIGCYMLITWFCNYVSKSLVFDGAAKWVLFGLIPVLGSFTVLYFSRIPALRSFLIACLIFICLWVLYVVFVCILMLVGRAAEDSPYEWERQKHVMYRPSPVLVCKIPPASVLF